MLQQETCLMEFVHPSFIVVFWTDLGLFCDHTVVILSALGAASFLSSYFACVCNSWAHPSFQHHVCSQPSQITKQKPDDVISPNPHHLNRPDNHTIVVLLFPFKGPCDLTMVFISGQMCVLVGAATFVDESYYTTIAWLCSVLVILILLICPIVVVYTLFSRAL